MRQGWGCRWVFQIGEEGEEEGVLQAGDGAVTGDRYGNGMRKDGWS